MIKRVGEVYKMKKTVFAAICMIGCLAAVHAASVKAAAESKPNFTVHEMKVDKSKIKNKKVTVIYTIKNTGTAAAPSSVAKLEIHRAGLSKQTSVSVPALKPGQIYTNSVDYDIVDGKKYNVKMTADYKNTINESNELDNENKVSFSVGRSF